MKKSVVRDYENYIFKDELAVIVTQLFQNFICENAPQFLKFGHSKFLYMYSTVLQVRTQLCRHDQAQRRLQRLEETVKLLEQQLKEKRDQIAVYVLCVYQCIG